MRHFEALHNVRPYDYSIRDPELSPLGQTQADVAIESVKNISSIDLIVCSPLTRTLQTYLLVFNNRRNIPLIIHPDLQEVNIVECDMGSPMDDLKIKFPILLNELNTFGETFGDLDWLDKTTPGSIYSPEQIKERGKRFLQWIRNRPEENIFVISHNLVLQQFLQDSNNRRKITLKNGEIKKIEYNY
jgi:broad specificity phosphatase PhoE